MSRDTDLIQKLAQRVSERYAPRNSDIGRVLEENKILGTFLVKLQGSSGQFMARNVSSSSLKVGDRVSCSIFTGKNGRVTNVEITGISSKLLRPKRVVWR
jgi:hypothetical protein